MPQSQASDRKDNSNRSTFSYRIATKELIATFPKFPILVKVFFAEITLSTMIALHRLRPIG
jgi:hypothetical protein